MPRYVRYTRGWYSSGPPQGQAALRHVRYGTRSRQVRVRHGCGTSYIFMFMSTPEGAITDRAALRERVGDINEFQNINERSTALTPNTNRTCRPA